MEDMELEAVVNVPDTPDRPISRHGFRGKHVGDMDEKSITDLAWRNLDLAENGNNRRMVTCQKICDHEVKTGSTPTGGTSLTKVCPQNNAPLFRRASDDKSCESRHSNVAEKMRKGKMICTNSPSKLSDTGKDVVFDLTEHKGQALGMKTAFPFQGSENIPIVGSTRKTPSTRSNYALYNFDSYANPSCAGIGMKRTVKNDCEGPNLATIDAKFVDLCDDSPLKIELQDCLPRHPLNVPRITRPKRLVRNGCIAPHNVATRTKELTKQIVDNVSSSEILGRSAVSRDKHIVNIREIVAEEKNPDKFKGKGLLIHQPMTNNDAGTVQLRNSSESVGERGGWRTTSRHLNNTSQSSQEVMGHPSGSKQNVGLSTSMQKKSRVDRKLTGSRQSSRALCNHLEDTAAHSSLGITSGACGVTKFHNFENVLNKQRTIDGMNSKNDVECRSSGSCDSDIILLDISGEPSNPRSDVMHTEELDAKVRQLEADERLALELQQQFYHEEPAFEVVEMDEYLARNLQHEEEAFHIDNINQSMPHVRLLPSRSNRQPRAQNNQNPSNRRRAQSQVLSHNRTAHSRSRNVGHSRPQRVSGMRRRFRFPLNMDLDMRLDILEAMESAAGDLDDTRMNDNIIRRDFNENDYEMLLALDENNHLHAGTSANQISSLPQCQVQTEAMEESCAICLETPTFGETICHLPCLHKFHKDCIDPWLLRKTSCPVCKSSIT